METLIIEAKDRQGNFIYIKNPVTQHYLTAIKRARELSKLPHVANSEVCTLQGNVIKHFRKH